MTLTASLGFNLTFTNGQQHRAIHLPLASKTLHLGRSRRCSSSGFRRRARNGFGAVAGQLRNIATVVGTVVSIAAISIAWGVMG